MYATLRSVLSTGGSLTLGNSLFLAKRLFRKGDALVATIDGSRLLVQQAGVNNKFVKTRVMCAAIVVSYAALCNKELKRRVAISRPGCHKFCTIIAHVLM